MKDHSLSDVQQMFEARTRGNEFGRFVDGQMREAVDELSQYDYADNVGKQDNVYAKQIWNEAIEAAALEALDKSETAEIAIVVCTAIRELKK